MLTRLSVIFLNETSPSLFFENLLALVERTCSDID